MLSATRGLRTNGWRRSTPRRRRAAIVLAMAVLTVVAALVAGTWAAFTAGSANPANAVAAGTVSLGDGGGTGGTMFDVSGMQPGDEVSRCITLSNAGSLPIDILSLYGTVGGTGLAAYLRYEVDLGNGAEGGEEFSCAGFDPSQLAAIHGPLSDFPPYSAMFDDVNAVPLDPGATRSYRITVTLPGDVAVAAQNTTASFGLTWVGTS
jgi:Camelysin metallo-endopeptidase